MRIVWDEPKRRANLERHGFDFATAAACDWDDALIIPSYRGQRGERRFLAILRLRDELIAIAFAPLGSEAVSLISMRPASRRERRLYAES